MLIIRRAALDAALDHACRGHPNISCGIVAGPEGSDRAERHVPMRNTELSRTFWAFGALEQYRLWRELESRDEEPVVIYYSQENPDAELSATTISMAMTEQTHYMVISTFHPDAPVFRSFRVVDGRAVEDEITVVDEDVIQDVIQDKIPIRDDTP